MALLIKNQQKKIKIGIRQLRQSVNKILKLLDCHNKELSLLLVDNKEIKRLNKQYLNRNRPTNVIAFSQTEGEFSPLNTDLMGDVVISVEKALNDATTAGLSLEDEMLYLIIHGILHLLGYNHENASDIDAAEMKNKADVLFNSLRGFRMD